MPYTAGLTTVLYTFPFSFIGMFALCLHLSENKQYSPMRFRNLYIQETNEENANEETYFDGNDEEKADEANRENSEKPKRTSRAGKSKDKRNEGIMHMHQTYYQIHCKVSTVCSKWEYDFFSSELNHVVINYRYTV